jgi:hypothetical protein
VNSLAVNPLDLKEESEPMFAKHLISEFAVLAMLCGAVMFFLIFPMTQGPYPVVNGPLTNLASIRARQLLLLGMIPVTVGSLGCHRLMLSSSADGTGRHEPLLTAADPPGQLTALRC